MKTHNIIFAFLAVTAVTGLAVAQTEVGKQATFINDKSWQVPGKVLKPGSYRIRVDDTMSDRSILQVVKKDGEKVHAMFLSVVNRELRQDGSSPFVFWKDVDGKKEVLRAWFVPGETFAREFVYEKKLAVKIATKANEIVPAVDPASEPTIKSRKLTPEDMRAIQLWALSLDTASPEKGKIQAAKLDRRSQEEPVVVQSVAQERRTQPAVATAVRPTEPAPVAEIPRVTPVAPVTPQQDVAPVTTRQRSEVSTSTAVAEAPATVSNAVPQPRRAASDRLPSGASDLPTVLLVGTLSASAGFILRARRVAAWRQTTGR